MADDASKSDDHTVEYRKPEYIIEAVKNKPVIWNRNDVLNRSSAARNMAWRDICNELYPDFETFSHPVRHLYIQATMYRWTNLRDTYKRYLTKLKNSTSGRKFKPYLYAKQMSFLDDSLTTQSNKKTLPHKSPSTDSSPIEAQPNRNEPPKEVKEAQEKHKAVAQSTMETEDVPMPVVLKKEPEDTDCNNIDLLILISEVKERTALWDCTATFYENARIVDLIWHAVCGHLNNCFPTLSDDTKNIFVAQVKNKWFSLRKSYFKHYYKKKKNPDIEPHPYEIELKFLDKELARKDVKTDVDSDSDTEDDDKKHIINEIDEKFNVGFTTLLKEQHVKTLSMPPDLNENNKCKARRTEAKTNENSHDSTDDNEEMKANEKDNDNIDKTVLKLIRLVKSEPLIWDQSHAHIRDTASRHAAWQHVCSKLLPQFNTMTLDQQDAFIKQTMLQWSTLISDFKKRQKKKNMVPHSYDKELSFLINSNPNCKNIGNTILQSEDTKKSGAIRVESLKFTPLDKPGPSKLPRVGNELEVKEGNITTVSVPSSSKALSLDESHILFFKGLLPALNNLTEQQAIEFRIKALNLVQLIMSQTKND